jgi:hypothetical protein
MTTIADLEAKLAAHEAETTRLRQQLGQLAAESTNQPSVVDLSEKSVTRRDALTKAAVAIAGVATGAAILRPTAALATDGDNLVIGTDNTVSNTGDSTTGLVTSAAGTARVVFGVRTITDSPGSSVVNTVMAAWADATRTGLYGYSTSVLTESSVRHAGVFGLNAGNGGVGVHGRATTGSTSVGVLGTSASGVAVQGEGVTGVNGIGQTGVRGETNSDGGYALVSSAIHPSSVGLYSISSGINGIAVWGVATGTAGFGGQFVATTNAPAAIKTASHAGGVHIRMEGTGVQPPLSRTTVSFVRGDIDYDTNGDLWLCVVGGTPGTWRKISGPATSGALHPITPTRVFDSRFTTKFAAGETRTFAVNQSISLSTGAVTGFAIPSGTLARAVAYNLTVADTVSAGFAAIYPASDSAYTASSINWNGANQAVANGSLVTLGTANDVKVFVNSAAHVIVDIVGYYV